MLLLAKLLLVKVTFLYGCFSRFSNCTHYGTKPRKTSQIQGASIYLNNCHVCIRPQRKNKEKNISLFDYNDYKKHQTRTLNMEYEINLETMKVRNNIKCTCCHYELSHLNHSKLASVLLYLNLSMHFDLTDIHPQIPETLKRNFQDKSLFLRIAMVIEQRKCL